MLLKVAGGVGEHGRNCFYVESKTLHFLVDCGLMAENPEDPNPHLSYTQIRRLDVVFLTHSHSDHSRALPWLRESGFTGPVIATAECFRQLSFPVGESIPLESLSQGRNATYKGLSIFWGRTGHCPGGVWFRFTDGNAAILFSGDYTENAQLYACDPIRNQVAQWAVLDCAYGKNNVRYEEACQAIKKRAKEILDERGLLALPVPRYGRGLELLKLLEALGEAYPFYGDSTFVENFYRLRHETFWFDKAVFHSAAYEADREKDSSIFPHTPKAYTGEARGIVFISDAQLQKGKAQQLVSTLLERDCRVMATGTIEKNSFAATLQEEGKLEQLFYPVHLHMAQFRTLCAQNHFQKALPYHTKDFSKQDIWQA